MLPGQERQDVEKGGKSMYLFYHYLAGAILSGQATEYYIFWQNSFVNAQLEYYLIIELSELILIHAYSQSFNNTIKNNI